MVQGKTQKRERPSIATRPSSDVLSLANRQSGAPAAAGEWPKKISRAWLPTCRDLHDWPAADRSEGGAAARMLHQHDQGGAAVQARTAQMLMVIAADPRLLKRTMFAFAAVLAHPLRADAGVRQAFEAGIASGAIHPEMDRRDLHGFIKTSGNWNWYTPPGSSIRRAGTGRHRLRSGFLRGRQRA